MQGISRINVTAIPRCRCAVQPDQLVFGKEDARLLPEGGRLEFILMVWNTFLLSLTSRHECKVAHCNIMFTHPLANDAQQEALLLFLFFF